MGIHKRVICKSCGKYLGKLVVPRDSVLNFHKSKNVVSPWTLNEDVNYERKCVCGTSFNTKDLIDFHSRSAA